MQQQQMFYTSLQAKHNATAANVLHFTSSLA